MKNSLVALCPFLGFVVACSSSNGSFSVAKHTSLPKIDDNGGGILIAPEIVTITFDPSLYGNAGADAATVIADVQAFDDAITTSAWWTEVSKDYCDPTAGCIGSGTAGAHVSIADLPPGDSTSADLCGSSARGTTACYTDTAMSGAASFKTYVSGLLQAGTLPAPGAQTLFVFYLPSQVTINVDGAVTCTDIGGYHDSLAFNGQDVPYAVVPVCDPEPTSLGTARLSIEQTATLAASHEIIEAATDPHGGEPVAGADQTSTKNLGWYLTDPASQAWATLAGGEVGDLCVDLLGTGRDRWTEGKYVYQRSWSNGSAAAGHDPCVPIPKGEVYFNAGPDSVASEELGIAVGAAAKLAVRAFSDAPRSDWQVFGVDASGSASSGAASTLTVSPSARATARANNGSNVSFSLRLNQQPVQQAMSAAGTVGVEPYLIVSRGGSTFHFWPALVVATH